MTALTLYFDGLCGPVNPGGIACYGWLLLQDGKEIAQGNGVEARGPKATNNMAEWSALLYGLRAAAALRPERLEIRGDSLLVINQLTGGWRMNAVHLLPYRNRCLDLLRGCQWQARWVPREENVAADALSRLADEEESRLAARNAASRETTNTDAFGGVAAQKIAPGVTKRDEKRLKHKPAKSIDGAVS